MLMLDLVKSGHHFSVWPALHWSGRGENRVFWMELQSSEIAHLVRDWRDAECGWSEGSLVGSSHIQDVRVKWEPRSQGFCVPRLQGSHRVCVWSGAPVVCSTQPRKLFWSPSRSQGTLCHTSRWLDDYLEVIFVLEEGEH